MISQTSCYLVLDLFSVCTLRMSSGRQKASCALHILMISCVLSTVSYFFLKLSDVGSFASSLVYFLPGLSRQSVSSSAAMGSLGASSPHFFAVLG